MFHDLDVSVQGRHVPENLKWKVGRVTVTGASTSGTFACRGGFSGSCCAKTGGTSIRAINIGDKRTHFLDARGADRVTGRNGPP